MRLLRLVVINFYMLLIVVSFIPLLFSISNLFRVRSNKSIATLQLSNAMARSKDMILEVNNDLWQEVNVGLSLLCYRSKSSVFDRFGKVRRSVDSKVGVGFGEACFEEDVCD